MASVITTEPYGRNKQITINYSDPDVILQFHREYCVIVDNIAYTRVGNVYTAKLSDCTNQIFTVTGGVEITPVEVISAIESYAALKNMPGKTTTAICMCPKNRVYRIHITRTLDDGSCFSDSAALEEIAATPLTVNGRTLYIGMIGEALSLLGDYIDPNKNG